MYKKLLFISFSALMVAACGGSSGSSSSSGTNGGNSNGGTNGGTDGGGTDGGGGPIITGEAGDFADKGSSENAIKGTYNLCAADVVSFSIFGQNTDGSWCVPKCPASGVENSDGDEFGSFLAENNVDRYSCFITPDAPGSQVELFFSAPADGCAPPAGCAPGTFPAVFVSGNAGDNLAGNYQCATWEFDVRSQDWSQQSSPAPFSLTLNVDRSANIAGSATTWSFANGVLSLEGNRTFNNVSVGNGSFTEYLSNTYITRCK